MENFIKGIFSIVTAIYISVSSNIPVHINLNPNGVENETIIQSVTSPSPSVSPVIENNNSAPTVPKTTQKIINPTSTPISQPTVDSDPIITCNSKTGQLKVRKSICSSHTDCPDGRGGYIFESQESCKKRWNSIGEEFKQLSKEYSAAMTEQARLQRLQLQQQLDFEAKKGQLELEQKLKNIENSVSQPTFKSAPLPSINNVPSSTSKIKCSELKGEAHITQVDCDPN